MQRPFNPSSKHTPIKRKGGEIKQTETSPKKSYRDNLTKYITTELMSNSVQYAHLGKYKIEKVSLLTTDANWTYVAKTLTGCVKV